MPSKIMFGQLQNCLRYGIFSQNIVSIEFGESAKPIVSMKKYLVNYFLLLRLPEVQVWLRNFNTSKHFSENIIK